MGKLDGKTAIITGAARGMGAATAELFVAEGANVVITDILETEGQAAADALGPQALFVRHDVSDEADWETAIKATIDRFGALTTLINNAGMLHIGKIEQQNKQVWEQVIGVNLIAAATGTRLVIPHMEAAGGGAIINVSSTEGLDAANGIGAYVASKWGLRGFTKTAAIELAQKGIRVNSIHPGPVNTGMSNPMEMDPDMFKPALTYFPQQRMADASEVAKVNLFLASEDASFVTGAEIAVDGGSSAGRFMKMLPGAPDNL